MSFPTRIDITSTTSVAENRAPTDESVRLLREMEEAARQQVMRAVAVGDNNFNAVVQFTYDNMSDATKSRLIFKVNGKKIETFAQASSWELKNYLSDPWIQSVEHLALKRLIDETARRIAEEVIIPVFAEQVKFRNTYKDSTS